MTDNILNHLAIIMDGNGRWAENRGRPRAHGHIKGARIAKQVITACARKGISQLTLYAFSSENWLRPPSEVHFLMRLLARYLARERTSLVKQNIRFSIIGEVDRLPAAIQRQIQLSIEETKHNTGLHLVFALSYGSRQEIVGAAKRLVQLARTGAITEVDVSEELFSKFLETTGTPDPDLVLRTSGEQRISNFLLWQCAYSEFYFTNTLWPDFTLSDLDRAIEDYTQRTRRFGQVLADTEASQSAGENEKAIFQKLS